MATLAELGDRSQKPKDLFGQTARLAEALELRGIAPEVLKEAISELVELAAGFGPNGVAWMLALTLMLGAQAAVLLIFTFTAPSMLALHPRTWLEVDRDGPAAILGPRNTLYR